MLKTFAFIFARGGSKGLRNKNIKILCGKPLIAHSILSAKESTLIDDVYVSTEDEIISQIALKFGAKVIKRPKDLAQDDSPEFFAWKHAVNYLIRENKTFDVFISLPATSPLRKKDDIEKCLKLFNDNIDVVVTIAESSRNPFFNMVKLDKKNSLKKVISNKNYFRRQDAPIVYDLTTVAYVTRPIFIKNNNNIFQGSLKGVVIPKERAIDIDDELDFFIAESIMNSYKK